MTLETLSPDAGTVVNEGLGGRMAERERRSVVTAAELEAMTPQERHDHFMSSVVTDLGQVPPAFLTAVREQLAPRIADRDARDIPHAS